jgi:hypothetical protein
MPTINVEMMKQLLEEFTEKEALTGEEIKVIEQQVANLNERIEACHDKLKNLSEDRERLAAMSSRYASGKSFSTFNLGMSKELDMSMLVSSSSGRTFSKDNSLGQSLKAENKEEDSSNEEEQSESSAPFQQIKSSTQANSIASPVETEEDKGMSEDQSNGEAPNKDKIVGTSDDAIKSINDALKGLFRK